MLVAGVRPERKPWSRRSKDVQKFGSDAVEATVKSFGAFSTSAQAIAVEMADYSKKALRKARQRPRR